MLRTNLLLITIITMLGLSILAGVYFSRSHPSSPPQPVPVPAPVVKPTKNSLVVKATDCDESPMFYMAGTHYDCRVR
jgi:hypothetical protein